MREILRVVESPRPCSYLESRTASLEYRIIPEIDAGTYADLLARGYRRFGIQYFRPACSSCHLCRSLRVRVPDFRLTRRYRRVLKANETVSVEIDRPSVTDEHLALYQRYHAFMEEHRGWPTQVASRESYAQTFVIGGGTFARELRYHRDGELIGVALMDDVGSATSLVYFYYAPEWRDASPGVFSILEQITYSAKRGYPYVYLGYWIPENRSMSYKQQYRPHEILTRYPSDTEAPVWEPAPDAPADGPVAGLPLDDSECHA